jgi:hypothetical protein
MLKPLVQVLSETFEFMLGAKYWHNGVGNDGGSFVRTVIILFLHGVHPFLAWILSKVQLLGQMTFVL